jgi:hypothetical protein
MGKNRGISIIGNSYKKFQIRKWTYRKMSSSKFMICPKMALPICPKMDI